MTSLTKELSAIMGSVFEELGLPAERGDVRVSDRPDLAQFQCNGAMACAKLLKSNNASGVASVGKNPREIAGEITAKLEANPIFSKVEIAGPGFINLDLTPNYIAEFLDKIGQDERMGIAEDSQRKTIVLDYGGMNVAKAMHVGHLRPNIVGDCIKKLLQFAGYHAMGDIHMGDWGLQMGQIISEFELRHPEWPYFDPANTGPFPEDPPFEYHELEAIYPEASRACKEDEARLKLAQDATVELQSGRPGYLALWNHFMTLSIADIKKNITPLGIDFDIWKGEASVNHLIPEITEDLRGQNIIEESDGALVIPVAQDDDKHDIPPLMYLNSRGAQTYGTTDIGTIYDRVKLYPDLSDIVYVTDKRQSLHFEQVFRACRKAGYLDGIETTHIGHGTINGPDGKPFKTRDGGTMKFADMIAAALDKARERLAEADLAADLGDDEKEDIAREVAVAALKYTELSNQPHVDYIFDLDRMTQFEGKTGPYLLYQAVRIQSLLRKAESRAPRRGV